ncbi:hypothetical protein [Guptibacillus spartinae]|uniref:hypothetical protein n=1 Tax=Guptibacillus spartinae TaxID=3025679 RepID=UPI002362BB94|nr:hypothetical protein [Pseudalkalibacillus spartinae]
MKTIKPNDYYEMEDAERESVINEIRTDITSSDSKIMKRMLGIANRYVKRYHSDFFVHDIHTLSNYSGRVMWYVHDCGTHIVKLDSSFKETMELEKVNLEAVKANYGDVHKENKEHHAYIVDISKGKIEKLSTITKLNFTYTYETKEEVLQKLIQEYDSQEFFEIMNSFKNEKKRLKTEKDIEDFVTEQRDIKKAV